MNKRVLFVLTSHSDLGGVRPTGFYVPEAAHPYTLLTARGYAVDFVSPQGGPVPMDGFKDSDPEQVRFLADNREALERTLRPDQVNPASYDAVFYVGGHGTMWDFPENLELANIARDVYEAGGVVSAVCHGPAGLLSVRLSSGAPLVAGKKVAAFTNAEERAVKLEHTVPFLLETHLKALGAEHVAAPDFAPNVQVSERLVTGQNPASARGVAEAMIELLERVPA